MFKCEWNENCEHSAFGESETYIERVEGLLINIYADSEGIRWAAVLKKNSMYGTGYNSEVCHVKVDGLRVYPDV